LIVIGSKNHGYTIVVSKIIEQKYILLWN